MFGRQIWVPNTDLFVADMLEPQWLGDLGGTIDTFTADEYLPTSDLLGHMGLIDIPDDEISTGTSTIFMQTNLKTSAQDVEDFEDLLEWSAAGYNFAKSPGMERFLSNSRCISSPKPFPGIMQSSETSGKLLTEHSVEQQNRPSQSINRLSLDSLPASVKLETSPGKLHTQSQHGDTKSVVKQSAHNVIEKRYRDRLNSKFAALERATCRDGTMSSGPLRKSKILSNAIHYVQELQAKNTELRKRVELLKGKPPCIDA